MDTNGIGEPRKLEDGGRFADAAAATLCRLNTVLRQMKNWREDRNNLKRNVHRLKSALRAISAETGQTLPVEPLIERQRERIGQLELANETLRRELSEVRGTGKKNTKLLSAPPNISGVVLVESFLEIQESELSSLDNNSRSSFGNPKEDDTRRKLREFVAVDQTMEIIFGGIASKVAETVANLSEELVNVSERMQRTRTKNYRLCNEIDRLRAILRCGSGTTEDYQTRVTELNELADRLRREVTKLGLPSRRDDYSYGLENLERLVSHLRNKLSNENDSVLAAGDPDCLTCVKKVIDLRVSLKLFSTRLANPGDEQENCWGNIGEENYSIAGLEKSLDDLDQEIRKLRDDRLRKYGQLSYIDGSKYAEELEELGCILEESRTTINSLKMADQGERRAIERNLEGLIDRLCREIKKLEVIVLDRSSRSRRIEDLEGSIEAVRAKLASVTDRANNLRVECSNTRAVLEQKIKELKDTETRLAAVTEENETFRSRTKSLEERVLGLLHERDGTRRQGIMEAQQVKREANVIRRKLENLQSEKKSLLARLARMRDMLIERNERIGELLLEKETVERTHNQEVAELREKLRTRQKNKTELNIHDCPEPDTLVQERMKECEGNLAEANREVTDLKARLSDVSGDKARLEKTVIELESAREFLLYQLGMEKTATEEKLTELSAIMSAYNESEHQNAELRDQKDRLRMELEASRAERDALDKSNRDIGNKYTELEQRMIEYSSELNKLRAEAKELTLALERTRAELSKARDEAERVNSENSRLAEDLASVGSTCTELEERVRVLLTERNEHQTRINELTDRLDRARRENECISVELNESRIERDKLQSEYTRLLEESERRRLDLERANQELSSSLNKIRSEYRVLDNQVKILREARGAATLSLQRVKNRFNKSDPSGGGEGERETNGIVSNAIPPERINGVMTSGQKNMDDTKIVGVRSEKRDRLFGVDGFELKRRRSEERLRLENAALRYELENLRGEHCRAKLELTRTKGQFEKLWIELTKIHGREEDQSWRRRSGGIVNLYYRQEVNGRSARKYTGYNKNALADIRYGSTGLSVELRGQPEAGNQGLSIGGLLALIENLKVENVSLRIELNTLRSVMLLTVVRRGREENGGRGIVEEMRALKLELTRLREEKESLRGRLETAKGEIDNLRCERTAMRAELNEMRLENSRIRHREFLLRGDYEKLQTEEPRMAGNELKRVFEIVN